MFCIFFPAAVNFASLVKPVLGGCANLTAIMAVITDTPSVARKKKN
jgi:hypothetical protein